MVLSGQFRVFDVTCVALLVKKKKKKGGGGGGGFSRSENKHNPIAISQAVDDSRM